jgi:hypothetical protein
MSLIEGFSLLSLTANILCIGTCLRINRRKVVRAKSMMRCLELAIRHEVACKQSPTPTHPCRNQVHSGKLSLG